MNRRQVVYAGVGPTTGCISLRPQWRYAIDTRTTTSICGLYVERWLAKG